MQSNSHEANLEAGDAFIFDSRTLHGVQEITHGERHSFIMFVKADKAVGDLQSHIEEKFEFGYGEGRAIDRGGADRAAAKQPCIAGVNASNYRYKQCSESRKVENASIYSIEVRDLP